MSLGKTLLYGLILICLFGFSLASLIETPAAAAGLRPKQRTEEQWITATIPEGGSIYSVLEDSGLPLSEIAGFTYEFGNYIDVTTIQPGDTLKLLLSPKARSLRKLTFVQEPTTRHHFTVLKDSLAYSVEELPVQHRQRILEGKLDGTLDASLLAAGLSPAEKQLINNGLEAKINFARDAKQGDSFRVFLEERVFEGQKLGGSIIHYVSYTGKQTSTQELFRYDDHTEKSVLTGLYSADGKNNNTSGVGFPLGAIHVISPFGSRIDPFYRRWRTHQGVDYRARYGTPVFAVANGSVESAKYGGGWGNEIRIHHASGLVTQYAHLSSMCVRAGQKVTRGQVIGRVGNTGRSTGAHLHFGLVSGQNYINPTNLKMVGAEKLDPAQLAEFKNQMQAIRTRMAALAGT